MKTPAVILALAVALAVPAEAKPKKDKNKDKGNDVSNLIEDVTGIDLGNNKKANKQIDQALDALTGSKGGKKNKGGAPNLGNLASLDTIRQYITGYRGKNNTRNLPPGLAKKVARGGELPPGWQKKVYRGGIFPNDLWPFASSLDYKQVPRFGNPGEGVDVYSIGNRLLKLNRSDNRILEVLDFD